jgi:alcohol dehydrogenase
MRLVKENLQRAVAKGTDLDARAHMMSAAAMGATAFQKGLGGVHALAHPVGALYDTHHGLTNAVILPYVLAHNRPAIDTKIARLAAWLGLGGGFVRFFGWVMALRQAIGIPHTLGELGIGDNQADLVAQMAVVDPTASGNPRPLDVPTARKLFVAAVRGDLEDVT